MPASASFDSAEHVFEVLFSVIVGKFFAGFNGAFGIDEHPLAFQDRFAIGFAGMIDVSSEIRARRPVDGVVGVGDIEEILAAFLLRLVIGHHGTPVFDDKVPALDGCFREKTETGHAALYRERMFRWSGFGIGHSMTNTEEVDEPSAFAWWGGRSAEPFSAKTTSESREAG